MKPDTAREVMGHNREAFTLTDGTFLGDLDDAQLTKYIEENPDENIRMSAYHLLRMQEEPYGARTDKQLFTLYAADTQEVRELNEQYGDESGNRAFDIKTRGENWDRLEPHLDDAMAWHALTDEQRATAVRQLESQPRPDTTSPSTRSTMRAAGRTPEREPVPPNPALPPRARGRRPGRRGATDACAYRSPSPCCWG